MIRAIIFDWGGIFTSQAPLKQFAQEYAQKHGVDFALFNDTMVSLWTDAKVGRISSQRFMDELASIAGVAPQQFARDLDDFSGFYPDVLAFVQQELQGKYKLGMITNHIAAWFEMHMEHKNLKAIFDSIITSYGSGAAKPETKIYQDALDALHVPASECVFIDDLEKNLPPAQALGMQTILYRDLPQLKQALRTLGVAV